ncbi:ribosome maturation factor RimM [Carboxydochorda subterranea]|uniref:Ribosome maturation factor RimM n=1 Tax=Carboxydichorda subterranea TaxID=3109565 RepID=A0ABZ1C097_9FIRM|nr:ribosome maturation factor RimM [Limnochorda sp. L945t]WRP18428.1 ribosome maturation factor RimM [Limnochorda sp. L945t]
MAQVLAPHGIRGEVRCRLLSDDPRRLAAGATGWLRVAGQEPRPARIVASRPGPRGAFLVKFEGVGDRSAAEALRGALLQIPVEQVRPLPEGSFYWFEVVGMEMVDEQGKALGTVSAIVRSAAHDLWEVTPSSGGPSFLVPAVRAFVRSVDRSARRIVVNLPPEL